ncbi:MAG: hypothetical protein Q4D02_01740 [Clostridia bacterium]|nr:hypothetical protein [Clostridia bacterium]
MNRRIFKDEPDETTPIEAEVLNEISNYETIVQESLITGEIIEANTDLTIPIMYKVGDGVLDVYYQGCKLVLDDHYIEVGNKDSISNRIQLKDWSAEVEKLFEFVVRGEWGTNE